MSIFDRWLQDEKELFNFDHSTGDHDDMTSRFDLPDAELKARVMKFCKDHNLDPRKVENLEYAGKQVLANDPDLGQRYQALPDDHERGLYGETR
jgi:hypothetical protein